MTSEAAGEVGFRVCGGMKFTAKWTEKAQIILRVSEMKFKDGGNKIVNENLVSK